MQYFPIFLTAKDIKALVIGGGDVAARKVELLLKTSAHISIMSANISDSVRYLIDKHPIEWIEKDYEPGYMTDKTMVIAATDDTAVNTSVHAEAVRHKILVNVVDEPHLCQYITPAIIDRDPMLVAMSSSGKSPILLRMLREKIERMLPEGYGDLAEFSGRFRDTVKAGVSKLADRRKFWEVALTGSIGQLVLDKRETEAEHELQQALKAGIKESEGQIHIIQCYDEPDNLTLKAHRAMQFADVLLFDKALNPNFIEYVRRDADKFELSEDYGEAFAVKQAEAGDIVIILLRKQRLTKIDTQAPVFYYRNGK